MVIFKSASTKVNDESKVCDKQQIWLICAELGIEHSSCVRFHSVATRFTLTTCAHWGVIQRWRQKSLLTYKPINKASQQENTRTASSPRSKRAELTEYAKSCFSVLLPLAVQSTHQGAIACSSIGISDSRQTTLYQAYHFVRCNPVCNIGECSVFRRVFITIYRRGQMERRYTAGKWKYVSRRRLRSLYCHSIYFPPVCFHYWWPSTIERDCNGVLPSEHRIRQL